ncbi:unnamed protein product [Amoebophrya sp. A120]|nr:unnamed protein product [Amoebophrya sp. A120]|eukprot:GSA120T00003866001.1
MALHFETRGRCEHNTCGRPLLSAKIISTVALFGLKLQLAGLVLHDEDSLVKAFLFVKKNQETKNKKHLIDVDNNNKKASTLVLEGDGTETTQSQLLDEAPKKVLATNADNSKETAEDARHYGAPTELEKQTESWVVLSQNGTPKEQEGGGGEGTAATRPDSTGGPGHAVPPPVDNPPYMRSLYSPAAAPLDSPGLNTPLIVAGSIGLFIAAAILGAVAYWFCFVRESASNKSDVGGQKSRSGEGKSKTGKDANTKYYSNEPASAALQRLNVASGGDAQGVDGSQQFLLAQEDRKLGETGTTWTSNFVIQQQQQMGQNPLQNGGTTMPGEGMKISAQAAPLSPLDPSEAASATTGNTSRSTNAAFKSQSMGAADLMNASATTGGETNASLTNVNQSIGSHLLGYGAAAARATGGDAGGPPSSKKYYGSNIGNMNNITPSGLSNLGITPSGFIAPSGISGSLNLIAAAPEPNDKSNLVRGRSKGELDKSEKKKSKAFTPETRREVAEIEPGFQKKQKDSSRKTDNEGERTKGFEGAVPVARGRGAGEKGHPQERSERFSHAKECHVVLHDSPGSGRAVQGEGDEGRGQ